MSLDDRRDSFPCKATNSTSKMIYLFKPETNSLIRPRQSTDDLNVHDFKNQMEKFTKHFTKTKKSLNSCKASQHKIILTLRTRDPDISA